MKLKSSWLAAPLAAFIVLLSHAGLAQAGQSELSHASESLSVGSVVVVGGALSLAGGGVSLIVKSVEVLADGVQVVLEGVSQAGTVSLKFSGKAADGLSLAVGSTVETLVLSTGTALVASGIVLAFIPNEIGRALLYHERSSNHRRS